MCITLQVTPAERQIEIYRTGGEEPILVQHAEADKRPFIHPIVAPDGVGVLTENEPPHHLWQHGLYVGLNDVNGVGFWEEGIRGNETDGTFHPKALSEAKVDGNRASWTVVSEWRSPSGEAMLQETQAWRFVDLEERYELDVDWTLEGRMDLTFGEYGYGGLFLRMPYRKDVGGEGVNSEGQGREEAEGQRAQWVAVAMPIEGRSDWAGMAMMDHPGNPEHPVPWRVDGQLGIAPSRCIAGAWTLGRGEAVTYRHRVLVYCGKVQADTVEASWKAFARN